MKKLWFKSKAYGWGWTPSSWEGWVIILIYVINIIDVFNEINLYSDFEVLIRFWIVTILLIIICYMKGEKPRWRWGGK